VALKTLAQGFVGIARVLLRKMKERWKEGHERWKDGRSEMLSLTTMPASVPKRRRHR